MVNPSEAAKEILFRRGARKSLIEFTRYTFPQYRVDPFHQFVALALDRIVLGEIKKLMIFAPPQHGKSELVSVRLPAFWLGKRPDDSVILCSYGSSLAEKHSRASRDIVDSLDYRILFPEVRLRDDARGVEHWQLRGRRGFMKVAGVGGPVTGHGGYLGIIDDPFENWAKAQSKDIRETVWDWWRGTFRPRIWENGSIILVTTRWHEDDLAGRLLKEQGSEWMVLRLPAIAETQEERDACNKRLGLSIGENDSLLRNAGEALSPSRYSVAGLLQIKKDVGSRVWYAEYQGSPRQLEGNRFKKEWFQIFREVPADVIRLVRYWDKAGTEGGGDYTAGVLMAKSQDGFYYIVHVERGQWSVYNRERIIKLTAELDRQRWGNRVTVYHEQEPASGGKESAEATTRNLAGFNVRADKISQQRQSKDVRLDPFEAQAEAGNVRLILGAWNELFLDELCALPNADYRDQSDAAGGAFNKLSAPVGGFYL